MGGLCDTSGSYMALVLVLMHVSSWFIVEWTGYQMANFKGARLLFAMADYQHTKQDGIVL